MKLFLCLSLSPWPYSNLERGYDLVTGEQAPEKIFRWAHISPTACRAVCPPYWTWQSPGHPRPSPAVTRPHTEHAELLKASGTFCTEFPLGVFHLLEKRVLEVFRTTVNVWWLYLFIFHVLQITFSFERRGHQPQHVTLDLCAVLNSFRRNPSHANINDEID